MIWYVCAAVLDKHTILSKAGTLTQTLDWIKRLAIFGSNDPIIIDKCNELQKTSTDLLKDVFDFAYSAGVYSPDPADRQLLKTVKRTFEDKTSNCVNYSIIIAAMLLRLKIDFSFRICGFNDDFEHIYIVAKDPNTGQENILDCVLGQRQDGTETMMTKPKQGQYNVECSYAFKRDHKMATLEVLNGISEINQGYINKIKPRVKLSRKNNAQLLNGLPSPILTDNSKTGNLVLLALGTGLLIYSIYQ